MSKEMAEKYYQQYLLELQHHNKHDKFSPNVLKTAQADCFRNNRKFK